MISWIREQSRNTPPIGRQTLLVDQSISQLNIPRSSPICPKSSQLQNALLISQTTLIREEKSKRNHPHQPTNLFIQMATTMATTMAILNAKYMTISSKSSPRHSAKPISIPTLLPKGLVSSSSLPTTALSASALAAGFFSALSTAEPAVAAQQLAEIAAGSADDNRGIALLLPIIPAIAWVLYNILQPALNQLNRMRSEKAVIVGIGLSGLAASGMLWAAPPASQAAEELGAVAEAAAGGDSRGQLLLIVILPAIGWVLYNILQPALNQLNRMRSE